MSLKAKDLRIGNIFEYHDQIVFVQKISNMFAEFGYFKDSIGFQRPFESHDFPKQIELTEDILLKCKNIDVNATKGHVVLRLCKDSVYDKVIGGYHNSFVLIKFESGWSVKYIFGLFGSHSFDRKFQYLHEFQNLYFALTGEELQINL
jgi:hypothetical protein